MFCLTNAINNSAITDSKMRGEEPVSAIDLVILGIVIERPQSAYDIQKDVACHHLSRWTKISTPSIYRKVLLLSEQGYLQSNTVRGERFADKAIYAVTPSGRAYFESLMHRYVAQPVPLLFDFNVVIANLNKLDRAQALGLLSVLRQSLTDSLRANAGYRAEFADIPLAGRAVIEQQGLLYKAMLDWLDAFRQQFERESNNGKSADHPV